MTKAGYGQVVVKKDLAGLDRIVVACTLERNVRSKRVKEKSKG